MRQALVLAGTLVLGLLGACSFVSDDVARVKGISPQGDAFQNALHKDYLGLADNELAEYHMSAASRWTEKAQMAAEGKTPAPDEPAAWDPPAEFVDELTKGRARLLAALGANASKSVPEQAAKAQTMYECWLEEQSENIQPAHIKACKAGFMDVLAQIEKPAPAAQPAPAALPGPYIVYFEFDAIKLGDAAMAVLKAVAADAKKHNPSAINVTGHTDRSGSDGRNLRLSERRAQMVAAELKRMGVTALIATYWAGEDEPRKPTADGVEEKENRRTEIVFKR